MTVETSALALLLGLLVAACGPISMQSAERECYEAATATARAISPSKFPCSRWSSTIASTSERTRASIDVDRQSVGL